MCSFAATIIVVCARFAIVAIAIPASTPKISVATIKDCLAILDVRFKVESCKPSIASRAGCNEASSGASRIIPITVGAAIDAKKPAAEIAFHCVAEFLIVVFMIPHAIVGVLDIAYLPNQINGNIASPVISCWKAFDV